MDNSFVINCIWIGVVWLLAETQFSLKGKLFVVAFVMAIAFAMTIVSISL